MTWTFLLIIYMVRIVQIQVADNYAKRPVAVNSEESLWRYKSIKLDSHLAQNLQIISNFWYNLLWISEK